MEAGVYRDIRAKLDADYKAKCEALDAFYKLMNPGESIPMMDGYNGRGALLHSFVERAATSPKFKTEGNVSEAVRQAIRAQGDNSFGFAEIADAVKQAIPDAYQPTISGAVSRLYAKKKIAVVEERQGTKGYRYKNVSV